jgi:very-short-patch-repair endonuclease
MRAFRLKHPTSAERIFAERLSLKKIKFEREVILYPYIADFVIPDRMLVIELDGGIHRVKQRHDERRDLYLSERGFWVMRLKNRSAATFDLDYLKRFPSGCERHYLRVIGRMRQWQISREVKRYASPVEVQ